MGYITFTIKQNEEDRSFILFHAEYINEAWVAEIREDNSTRIIREFDCKRLDECIDEIILCIDHLGEVTKMIPTEIDEDIARLLEERLMHEAINTADVPKLPVVRALNPYYNVWGWLSNSFAELRIAN